MAGMINAKRTAVLALLAAACLPALAGAKGGFTTQDAGIVTPDLATGFRAFTDFTSDTNGDLVVCTKPSETTRGGGCELNGQNGWRPLKSFVPANRTYVGFRVVSGGYGYRQLELYWK